MDELVDLLGLDIPPVPEVSLAGITAESVLLYWKSPENYSMSLKHAIQVNGIKGVLRTRPCKGPVLSTADFGFDQWANSAAAIRQYKSLV